MKRLLTPQVRPMPSDPVRLTTDPCSPSRARQVVQQAIDKAHWEGDREIAVLLTSEIASNALRHGGALTQLEVIASGHQLHVEAADPSLSEPRVSHVDHQATSGRGMALVDSLSDKWGVHQREGAGKIVWFDLTG